MKKILTATAIAAALSAGNAQAAGQTSGQFNVNITLTSACTLAAVTDLAFAYTSQQIGVSNATGGGFSVTCTNTLPYTFALQAGTNAPAAPYNTSISVLDALVGLNYTLNLSATSGTGNGNSQSYSVTGTMAGSQSGTCAAATCTNSGVGANNRHTLIVNY